MVPVNVAVFDLDRTLIDRDAGFAAWLDVVAGRHGLGASERDEIERLDRAAKRRDVFFDAVAARLPRLGDAATLWAEYRRMMPTLAAAFPGVLDGLRRLRAAGWRVGVASNGQVDNQEGKLAASGIAALLDGWCVSAELGVRKPDAGIFRAAVQRTAGPGAHRVWVIGDDPVLDVAGAARCGMRTVWVSHGDDWPDGLRPDPDVVVATPAEAFDRLTP